MKRILLAVVTLSVLMMSAKAQSLQPMDWQQPPQLNWEEDLRRCAISRHLSDDVYIRFFLEDQIEMQMMKGQDDVVSVRIDKITFPVHPSSYGYNLGSPKTVLPALARGKRLQIFVKDKTEPIVDVRVYGKKAVAFLRKCDMYWTNVHIATNAWEKGRASAKVEEYARAIREFDQAIQKFPKEYTTKRARILFERGQAKLRKGDKTGGNADIRAATKLRRWIATMDDITP
jgi:tetratricopeptide (TPR) repeat protein